MPSEGFEPASPAIERLQTYALDNMAIRIGHVMVLVQAHCVSLSYVWAAFSLYMTQTNSQQSKMLHLVHTGTAVQNSSLFELLNESSSCNFGSDANKWHRTRMQAFRQPNYKHIFVSVIYPLEYVPCVAHRHCAALLYINCTIRQKILRHITYSRPPRCLSPHMTGHLHVGRISFSLPVL